MLGLSGCFPHGDLVVCHRAPQSTVLNGGGENSGHGQDQAGHQCLGVLAMPQSSKGCSSAMGPGAACSPISPFTAAVWFPVASLASGSLLLRLLCL